MTNRRTFLKNAGILAGGILISPALAQCGAEAKGRNIGLQLYSLRDQISEDVKGVIAKVKQAGYSTVETYGYSVKDKFWGLSPAAFDKLLSSNGLTSFSGHYGLDEYLVKGGNNDVLKTYIEAASAIGQTYITIPHVASHIVSDADGYKQVAEKLNNAAELCKYSKLRIAYHNHDFEFNKIGQDETGYDILLKETEPSMVDFELDLYWAIRAGIDPVALFSIHSGRFTMWHVKDMDKNNPKLNTEVGAGSIDFTKILAAEKASGLKQLFVEQENFSKDPFQSISQSYQYLHTK
ncbi:sugar phosphate isomerase/epimerase family protein [Desertivirga xinjiangensis]|uniref:sugar phosphate isomerase/epimerase family protein n=1 Tax=Desertivirga xinjiangensis TaxID=539206 RepID=UPI00210CFACF|nr:sugar phosphate isomerase/epimerase [Pedobacter xinjiangensis]